MKYAGLLELLDVAAAGGAVLGETLRILRKRIEQIRQFLEVDSLAYLSLEGMLACAKNATSAYCTACWSGRYKISIDQSHGKMHFEHGKSGPDFRR